MLPTGSTHKNMIKIIYLDDAKNHAEQMKTAMINLYGLLQKAQCEYSLYSEQKLVAEKHFPTQLSAAKELFARDFEDFKNALNTTIRAYKQFHEDFKIQLALLGKNNPFMKEVVELEKSIKQLKEYYLKDKNLYSEVKLSNENPDVVKLPTQNPTDAPANVNMNRPTK